MDDVDSPEDNHRHISHLYGLFPSNQISPYRTPQLFAAAKIRSCNGEMYPQDGVWLESELVAKMQDGNHAYKLITDQLTPVGVNRGVAAPITTYSTLTAVPD
ncbi:hypothetical protein Q2T40_01330 [Winogradskyella maritima]|nr:hypothetical protein [Winogradskyella maritima]